MNAPACCLPHLVSGANPQSAHHPLLAPATARPAGQTHPVAGEKRIPRRRSRPPPAVIRLRAYGLEIRFCENLRSYKKIVPALQEYPDAILVTADDDWLYTQDWLAGLWHPYERHPHDIHACRSPAFPHPGRPAPALHDLTERAGRNRARRLAPARFHRLRRGAVPSSRSALRCGPPGTFHGSRAHGRRSLAVVHGDGAGNARAHCCRTRPVHHTREGRRAGKHASAPGLKNWPEPGGQNDAQLAALLFRGAHPILRETKKAPQKRGLKNALALFYFPTQIYAVSSTMEGLTAEFGMGSGVPPPP